MKDLKLIVLVCYVLSSDAFVPTSIFSLNSNNKQVELASKQDDTTYGDCSSSVVDSQILYDETDDKIRLRGRITYNGAGFSGWQVQAKGRTVQGELESVLTRRFNRRIQIVGAGRTDRHVHARGQAFHFDIYPHEIKSDMYDFLQKLQYSLNSMLPSDAKVFNLGQAPPPVLVSHPQPDGTMIEKSHKWHVIYNAEKKLYIYRISLAPFAITNDPVERFSRVHVEGNVDPNYLQVILKHYEGTHDFRAFAGAIEANARKDGIDATEKDTVRTVYSVNLVDEGDGNYRIEILLKGALYKMVRNMVGTALDVCKGRLEESSMLELLHGDDMVRKNNKSKPAPPEGLTLENVFYDVGF